jgi:hypothetical protein
LQKKLDSKDFGKYGLMFYNAFFMAIPAFLFAYIGGEIHKVSLAFTLRYQIFLVFFKQRLFPGF